VKTLVGQLGAVLLFAAGAVSVYAEDPAKPASQGAAAQKNPFEGLGFSIAPREGGKARTSLFGVVGEGYKFVYVFDRSGSMGGQGENSLQAVKKELLASLKNLDTVHQFQIVFYNQRPALFNPTGTPGRLAFATEQTNGGQLDSSVRSSPKAARPTKKPSGRPSAFSPTSSFS